MHTMHPRVAMYGPGIIFDLACVLEFPRASNQAPDTFNTRPGLIKAAMGIFEEAG